MDPNRGWGGGGGGGHVRQPVPLSYPPRAPKGRGCCCCHHQIILRQRFCPAAPSLPAPWWQPGHCRACLICPDGASAEGRLLPILPHPLRAEEWWPPHLQTGSWVGLNFWPNPPCSHSLPRPATTQWAVLRALLHCHAPGLVHLPAARYVRQAWQKAIHYSPPPPSWHPSVSLV